MTDSIRAEYYAGTGEQARDSVIAPLATERLASTGSLHKTGGVTLNSIQSLRAIAAFIVVVFHSHIGFASSYPALSFANEAYLFGFGKVGVHIFFVISGYIMYLTSFGTGKQFAPKSFLTKRFLRVYPIYWVFVVLYVAVAYLLMSPPKLAVDQYVGMVLLLPGTAPLLIGPAWTLSYEIYFYIAFAAAMMFGQTRGLIALTVFFSLSIALGFILRPQAAVTSLMTNALLLEFIMGVWIARVTTLHALPKAMGWVALGAAVIGYAIGLALGYDRLPSAALWGMPSALLVAGAVILEQHNSAVMTALYKKVSWLGDSSYSLYLCHILIIELVLNMQPFQISLIALVALNTIACVVFAAIFYRLVERPFIQYLQRWLVKRA